MTTMQHKETAVLHMNMEHTCCVCVSLVERAFFTSPPHRSRTGLESSVETRPEPNAGRVKPRNVPSFMRGNGESRSTPSFIKTCIYIYWVTDHLTVTRKSRRRGAVKKKDGPGWKTGLAYSDWSSVELYFFCPWTDGSGRRRGIHREPRVNINSP